MVPQKRQLMKILALKIIAVMTMKMLALMTMKICYPHQKPLDLL